ncbi:hypothetical protein Q4Q52_13320 [Shewanella sp. SP1S2-4]|uniref:hypothetical protein n=1 Tax=Shewanella sp. SP1S2-4 TaxID=3063537 RepID=UPI002890459D|nr:hypothetical protein [Shewanella sp. SP1S2-4]MDT3320733.1 hypothetical protein [Shewanella sp. SP1S2-4]
MPNAAAIPEAITWLSPTTMFAILAAFVTVAKLISYLHFERHKFNHKNLEIVLSTLSANLHKPSLKQRFLTEHVFSLMYRCKLTYDEINVLLRYSNPSRAFELFVKGKAYLKLSNNLNSITLNGCYWSIPIWKRKVYARDLLLLSCYVIFGIIGTYAIAPFVYVYDDGSWFTVPKLFESYGLIGIMWASLSILGSFIFWIFAFKSITSIGNMSAAFRLVEIERKSLK